MPFDFFIIIISSAARVSVLSIYIKGALESLQTLNSPHPLPPLLLFPYPLPLSPRSLHPCFSIHVWIPHLPSRPTTSLSLPLHLPFLSPSPSTILYHALLLRLFIPLLIPLHLAPPLYPSHCTSVSPSLFTIPLPLSSLSLSLSLYYPSPSLFLSLPFHLHLLIPPSPSLFTIPPHPLNENSLL